MRKKSVACLTACLLGSGFFFHPALSAFAAVQEVTVDAQEYNLRVEDIPSFTSEWDSLFAKMNNKKDASSYALSFFDDTDSTYALEESLQNSGVAVDIDNICGIDMMLYERNKEDEDLYPVEGSVDVTIICPVPDLWMEDAQNVTLYQVNPSNKAVKVASTLVSVNEVPCMKFTMKATGVYGFVYNYPEEEKVEEGQEETATAPVTPTPTKAPSTKIPTKTVEQETTTSSVTIAPTKGLEEDANKKTNASTKRPVDATPQTGDTTPLGLLLAAAGISGGGITGMVYYLKKK